MVAKGNSGEFSSSRLSLLICRPDLFIRRISQLAASCVILSALNSILGTVFSIPLLTNAIVGEPLPLIVRFAVLCAALALLLVATEKPISKLRTKMVQAVALVITVISISGVADPEHLCLSARFCLVLLGFGLFCLAVPKTSINNLAQYAACVIFWWSSIALSAFFYGFDFILHLAIYSGIALRGALGFYLLAVAMFLARPQGGPASVLLAPGAAGAVARRIFLPSCIVIPAIGSLTGLGAHYERDLFTLVLLANFAIPFSIWVVVVYMSREEAEKVRLAGLLQRQLWLWEARTEILNEALTSETLNQLGKTCLSVLERLTASKFGFIGLMNADGLQDILALSNPGWDACNIPEGQAKLVIEGMPIRGVDRAIYREGKSRIINGEEAIKAHPDHVALPEGHPPLKTFLGVPLKEAEQVIGLIGLANKDSEYTPADREIVESLSGTIVEVIYRKKSEITVRELNLDLQILNSELRVARDQAQTASQFKSEFVANMSHEIRTPLNAILGICNLLVKTPLNDTQRNYGKYIQQSGEALLTIVNDILDLSKIAAGKLELEIADFDPVQLLESMCTLLDDQARSRKVALLSYVEPKLPTLLGGDADRLRQVLLNFLGNAIKFSENNEVLIKAVLEDEQGDQLQVLFSVADRGIGLSEEDRRSLFQPFSQVARSRRLGGAGLGLNISRSLVELMGGTIGVESEPGSGSTFWCRVPLARRSQAPGIASNEALSKLKVLIADDMPRARETLQGYLSAWGMFCQTASSCREALEIMRQACADGNPFAVVLDDLSMSEDNSLNLARGIKQDPALSTSKLIMLTESFSDDLEKSGSDSGIFSCLPKPVKQSQLLNCIISAIQGEKQLIDKAVSEPLDASLGKGELRKELILIAEDHEINQHIALLYMKELGFESKVVNNGQEAIEALSEQHYDLVLMDCQMPILDGISTAKIIRNNERVNGGHIPIIAMTANAMKGDREDCIAAGMDDYISKPIDPENVRNIIDKWLPDLAALEPVSGNQAAETPQSTAPIDLAKIEQKYGVKNVERLVTMFLDDAPRQIEKLRQSAASASEIEVRQLAHGLKGVCGTVFADKMRQICLEIETAGRDKNWNTLPSLIQQLDIAFNELHEFVKDSRQNN